jgi:hypothetical protein
MWIKTDNDNLKQLAPEGVDWEDRVVFNDSNSAQVTKELGERLVEEYEDIYSDQDDESDNLDNELEE